MRIDEALRQAAASLADVSATPRLDAELLMAHALGVDRNELLLSRLGSQCPAEFPGLVERRRVAEPVAYITGVRDFWTIRLRVGPGVLVPRPDSETLIEAAIAHFGDRAPHTILDLGTGSGALLLAALSHWPAARGLGIDAAPTALDFARRNAAEQGLADRAEFRLGDWADGIAARFDLILCNPPYVEADAQLPSDVSDHEPHAALFAGADGLDDYRRLAPTLPRLIGAGGVACVEIGYQQASSAGSLFRAAGLGVAVRKDLGGRDRCLVLTQNG